MGCLTIIKRNIYSKLSLSLLITCIIISSCANSANKPLRNTILMIGDGMGINHTYAAYTANKGRLTIYERSHAVGLAKTTATDNYIPDSAAAGTAIASGKKTNNGMLGLLPDGTHVKSVLDYASDNGLSTGIVVTSELSDPTPAAFVAHIDMGDRPKNSKDTTNKLYEHIATEFVNSKINVAIGGGRKFFEDRKDGQNLSDTMRAKGFRVVYTLDEMKTVRDGNLLALLSEASPRYYPTRGEMLTQGITTALNILSKNSKGFFLMVEGSQIDWASHDNNQERIVNETLDFDRAVKIAFDFAERNGNTLVIVTSDHETGGLSISDGNIQSGKLTTTFTSTKHTGAPVPVYAFGPGAEKFTGVYENTELLSKILELYQISK